MNPVWATFFGTVVVQLIIAAFVYGRLTEKVKTVNDRTIDHGRRVTNIETVISGTGGHGERLTALEAWRIESREKNKL